MTDAWRKQLDDGEDTLAIPDAHGAVRIGARQERRQLAFVPTARNTAFNRGRGLSLEYAHLLWVDFALDYSDLVLGFTTDCVTIQGHDLKGLYDLIRAHMVDLVEQADPLHALADPLRFPVTGLLLGPAKERDYA